MIPPVLAAAAPAPPPAAADPAAGPDGAFARVLDALRGPGRDGSRDTSDDTAEGEPGAPALRGRDRDDAAPAAPAPGPAPPDPAPPPAPAVLAAAPPAPPIAGALPDSLRDRTVEPGDLAPPSRPAVPAPDAAAPPAAGPLAGFAAAAAEGVPPAPAERPAAQAGADPEPAARPGADRALPAAALRIDFPGQQDAPLVVALDGGELGRLRLECRVEEGVLHLRPESDLPAARDLLLRAGDLLDREARAAGLSGAVLDDGSGRGSSRRPAPGRAPPADGAGAPAPGFPALPAVVVVHPAAAAAAGLDLRL